MNPLFQKVLKSQRYSPSFYTCIPFINNNDETLHQMILSKLWSTMKQPAFSVKTSFETYLAEKVYFNYFENRFISRNDLIRLFADSDGAHFDDNEDLYIQWLMTSMIETHSCKISQAELFMWDILLLVDWHLHRLKIEIEHQDLIKKHSSSFRLEAYIKSKVDELSRHYDQLLVGPGLVMTQRGERRCSSCKSGRLISNIDISLKCTNCGFIVEL